MVGEGLLPKPSNGPTAGFSVAERLQAEVSPPFHFSRMGPLGVSGLDRATRCKVAEAMTVGGGGIGRAPMPPPAMLWLVTTAMAA